MARTSKRTRPQTKVETHAGVPFHAFWSGALSFGLVRVPVFLFPATRHSGVRLRMMSPDGAIDWRRYYCPCEAKQIVSDEIVRGYELDNGSYIIVSDAELAAAEPIKSQEIELHQFVRLSEVTPAIMERGYYLTPGKGAAAGLWPAGGSHGENSKSGHRDIRDARPRIPGGNFRPKGHPPATTLGLLMRCETRRQSVCQHPVQLPPSSECRHANVRSAL